MHKLYRIKEVGNDTIVLSDGATEVRIAFAGNSGSAEDIPITKEEHAEFFKGIRGQVGLQTRFLPLNESRVINIFIDYWVDKFGWLRFVPFPFRVSRVEVTKLPT